MNDIKIVTHYEEADEPCCKDYLCVTVEVDGVEKFEFGPGKYATAEDEARKLLGPEQRMRFQDINDGRFAS
jgi:hypothetical protein